MNINTCKKCININICVASSSGRRQTRPAVHSAPSAHRATPGEKSKRLHGRSGNETTLVHNHYFYTWVFNI